MTRDEAKRLACEAIDAAKAGDIVGLVSRALIAAHDQALEDVAEWARGLRVDGQSLAAAIRARKIAP